jgi:hypothetical protein
MPAVIGELLIAAAGYGLEVSGAIAFGTVTYATIVGDVALVGGSIGLSLLTRPGAPKPQDGQQTVQQPSAPRRRNYGLVKVGGYLLFSEVDQGQRYQVIAINQGEIDAFVSHWYDANQVALDDAGHATGVSVLFYRIGLTCYSQVGLTYGTDDDTAFAALITDFPTLWTSAHQGNGIAKVLTSFIQTQAADFSKVYPGAAPPVYRAVIQSSKVWDPRDLTQDRNDKTSWKYSVNPMLQALDFHRVADGMGLAVFDDIFFTDAAINQDWIPAADICDEQIALKAGGTAARYACAGGYTLATPPKTVLASMFATCDGQTYQRADGAIGVRVGKTVAPTVTLDDDDITGYDSLRRGPSDSLVPVNQVTAKYTASLFDFQENDAEPWQDLAAIAAAGGRIESRDIDLHWVYLHPQARRLMKLALARLTPEWSGKIITGIGGLRAWGERFVHVTIAELGIDGDFEVTSFEINPSGLSCSIGISALDQSAYDWDPDTEEGSEGVPPAFNDGSNVIPDPTSVAASATGHVLTITWDPPFWTFVTAEAQYSLHGANNWFDASVNQTTDTAVSPVLPAGSYDVQVSFLSGTLRSDWVPVLAIAV